MEDEASVDWIGEALRPPTPGEVDGEDEALSPTPSTPEEYLPLSDAAVWRFQAPAPAPAPAPGRATYTPGRVTWGHEVSFGNDMGAETPETPKRHIFFAPPSPTDTNGGAFSPTPSMQDRPMTGGAPTPTPSMRFSPSHDDLYAAPAPAYTPGRTPGTPGVRWSDDIRGATPTPSMAYSRAATPGTPTPSMACSPDEMQDDDDDSMATAAQAAQDDSPPWRTLDDEGAFSPTPSMADRPLTGGGPSEDQSR